MQAVFLVFLILFAIAGLGIRKWATTPNREEAFQRWQKRYPYGSMLLVVGFALLLLLFGLVLRWTT
jgi:hypothetical protein